MIEIPRVRMVIEGWARTEFPEAQFKYDSNRQKYQLVAVTAIDRVWKSEEDSMLLEVDATIAYTLGVYTKKADISFQLNHRNYEVEGFAIHEIDYD